MPSNDNITSFEAKKADKVTQHFYKLQYLLLSGAFFYISLCGFGVVEYAHIPISA